MPRGIVERRGRELIDAVARGVAVPEDALPKYPRAPRWDKDPEFDERVNRLRGVRETAAAKYDLDPGVLASRDRLETIARAKPKTLEELAAVPDVRKWQAEVLGEPALRRGEGLERGSSRGIATSDEKDETAAVAPAAVRRSATTKKSPNVNR